MVVFDATMLMLPCSLALVSQLIRQQVSPSATYRSA